MDLLCTENIMHDYESENLYQQHLQAVKQQQQQTQQVTGTINQQHQHNVLNSDGGSPAYNNNGSLLSSTSSISSTSSSASSGYNSVISNSSSTRRDSTSSRNSAACSMCCQSSNVATTITTTAATIGNDNNLSHHQQQQKQTQEQQQQQPKTQQIYLQHQEQALRQHQQQQQQQQPIQHNAYTNNLINRTLDYVNTATEDPTFLSDRCLENALKAEQKQPQPVCSYFKTVQKDITPPMRKIVADWMMEVCAEEKCQEEVVLLALNYMDRFLSTKSVRKTHLQILAAACLLLASKLREPSCRALSAELLVFYTDNSIYKGDLIKWELFVLSRLGWDLSSVTPLDFLELLLIRLPIRSNICPDLSVDKVRQHAQAFISLAAKEHYFSIYSASTIAAASIAAALSGLNWHLRTGQNLRYLLNLLSELTTVKQNYLHDCMMKMEHVFEEHSRNLQSFLEAQVPIGAQQAASTIQQQQQQQHQQQNCQLQQQEQQQQQQQQNLMQIQMQEQEQQQIQQQPQQQQCHLNESITSLSHTAQLTPALSTASTTTTTVVMLPNLTQTCKMQANTQKDVQDIKF